MDIIISKHAIERMGKYGISNELLNNCIRNPDTVVEGYGNRVIHQKRLNGYLLRVVIEKGKEIKTVVTAYKARRKRYGI
jgi:fructose-specific phosphotransferase system component IIB